ncbi:uncharacterized protein B0H64DRAFT_432082 [Chaetomium fimeti]|uniref:Aminoglycoside phosphotransferase domain-containing protein n=1 Tax=Chaetomium fimeti TaxID=1854472 RepID=A0AAE0LRZ7_9PEZI|nr:hypothetical protein B0H64DRAFT_432082 [Chaetomium fimeti]
MATRTNIPYYARKKALPEGVESLPTVEDILASTDRISTEYNAYYVYRVGVHFVVKYGQSNGALLQEGENMLFVERSTTLLRIPKVYAVFHDEATGNDFIVQEYIPGQCLGSVWRDLTATQKTAITSQLRQGLDELRSIPSPGYYGGIWRQPTRECNFEDPVKIWEPHNDVTISGPQETEEQWIDAMWRCAGSRVDPSQRDTLPQLRVDYHAAFKGHKPVFTHACLFRSEMILREDGVVVLIDWEYAGWYPTYWEYCSAMWMGDRWGSEISEILDEFIPELDGMIKHKSILE